MNTLPARETRAMLAALDAIRELTTLLRHAHFDVTSRVVYDAVSAEASIRKRLLEAAVTDIAVEAPDAMKEAA